MPAHAWRVRRGGGGRRPWAGARFARTVPGNADDARARPLPPRPCATSPRAGAPRAITSSETSCGADAAASSRSRSSRPRSPISRCMRCGSKTRPRNRRSGRFAPNRHSGSVRGPSGRHARALVFGLRLGGFACGAGAGFAGVFSGSAIGSNMRRRWRAAQPRDPGTGAGRSRPAQCAHHRGGPDRRGAASEVRARRCRHRECGTGGAAGEGSRLRAPAGGDRAAPLGATRRADRPRSHRKAAAPRRRGSGRPAARCRAAPVSRHAAARRGLDQRRLGRSPGISGAQGLGQCRVAAARPRRGRPCRSAGCGASQHADLALGRLVHCLWRGRRARHRARPSRGGAARSHGPRTTPSIGRRALDAVVLPTGTIQARGRRPS